MIIVFDLDDTLYEELTFVKSGFVAVADFLECNFGISSSESYELMVNRLELGRGKIFDDTLSHFGVLHKQTVDRCLTVYRKHFPKIQLHQEAEDFLVRFAHEPLYIVTDGNKMVQNNKIIALGLRKHVKHVFITHRYGVKHAKPSPYCFQKICEIEKVEPREVVYVGDNPHKDFVGIKPLGFQTIRINQGSFKNVKVTNDYEAHSTIGSLRELTIELLESLDSKECRK